MKTLCVDLRTTVFPLEAVFSACYAFIDRAYVRLEDQPRQTIRVHLDPKEPMTAKAVRALEGEFRNELLHHALRLRVAVSNQKIRTYIVTRALLSAQPNEQGGPPRDPPPEAEDGKTPRPRGKGGRPKSRPAKGERRSEEKRSKPDKAADDTLAKEIRKLLAEVDQGE